MAENLTSLANIQASTFMASFSIRFWSCACTCTGLHWVWQIYIRLFWSLVYVEQTLTLSFFGLSLPPRRQKDRLLATFGGGARYISVLERDGGIQKKDPQYRPQNIIIRIIGAPKEVPQFWETTYIYIHIYI